MTISSCINGVKENVHDFHQFNKLHQYITFIEIVIEFCQKMCYRSLSFLLLLVFFACINKMTIIRLQIHVCFVGYCLTSAHHHDHILEPHTASVSCLSTSSCCDLFIHTTFDAIAPCAMPAKINVKKTEIRPLAGFARIGVLTEGRRDSRSADTWGQSQSCQTKLF